MLEKLEDSMIIVNAIKCSLLAYVANFWDLLTYHKLMLQYTTSFINLGGKITKWQKSKQYFQRKYDLLSSDFFVFSP